MPESNSNSDEDYPDSDFMLEAAKLEDMFPSDDCFNDFQTQVPQCQDKELDSKIEDEDFPEDDVFYGLTSQLPHNTAFIDATDDDLNNFSNYDWDDEDFDELSSQRAIPQACEDKPTDLLNLDEIMLIIDDKTSEIKRFEENMVKSFQCCSEINRKVRTHITKKASCKRKLAEFLEIDPSSSVDQIMNKKKKILRARQPCRQPEYRAKKRNSYLKSKEKLTLKTKVYTCYSCKLTSQKESLFEISLLDNTSTSTDSKTTYKCHSCIKENINNCDSLKVKGYKTMTRVNLKDRNIMVPVSLPIKTGCQLYYPPTIMIPNSFGSVNHWFEESPPKFRTDLLQATSKQIGSYEMSTEDYTSALYEHTLHRIEKRKSLQNMMVTGNVIDTNERIVETFPFQPNLRSFKGSDDYYQQLDHETRFFFTNNGTISIMVTLDLKKDVNEIWHEFLLQEDKVTVSTTEQNGEKEYWVKTEHSNLPVPLKEYLQSRNLKNENLEEPQFLHLLADNYYKKFNCFTNCLKTEFEAENFQSVIQFPIGKEPIMKMVIWPKWLALVNQKIARNEVLNLTDYQKIEDSIGRITTTALREKDFQNMGFNSEDIVKLQNLTTENQWNPTNGCIPSNFNLIMRPAIKREDSNIQWELSESSNFTEKFLQLKEIFMNLIASLNPKHFKTDSTISLDSVLYSVEISQSFQLEQSVNQIKIKLPKSKEIISPIDEVLYSWITSAKFTTLSAVYHRAMCITRDVFDYSFIAKRPYLNQCRVSQFNPSVSLLNNSMNSIKIIGKNHTVAVASLLRCEKPDDAELEDIKINHEEITLLNSVFMIGKAGKYKYFNRSSSTIFLNPLPDASSVFQEVKGFRKNEHYRDQSGSFYELIPSVYNLYLDRKNVEHLCFMQFAMYYEKELEKGESNEDDFSNMKCEAVEGTENTASPEETDIEMVTYSKKEKIWLPKSIQTKSHGTTFILKKYPKMVYHSAHVPGSDDYNALRVIFFHAHSSREEVIPDYHDLIINSTQEDGNQKKLDVIEEKLFPARSSRIFKDLFF